jgi:hypothetical protein
LIVPPETASRINALSAITYFPDIAGRDAHAAGRGGDILRDVERMNAILRRPAHVQKVDILFDKRVFA